MKRTITLAFCVLLILSLTISVFASECNTQGFTPPTAAEIAASEEKLSDMSQVAEILGHGHRESSDISIINNMITAAETQEVNAIISKYNSSNSAASILDIYHYVAGEGYNTSDSSNRVCIYVDPNDSYVGTFGSHQIGFRLMCTLIKDRGLVC